jgi:hypothetical protein
LKPLQEWAATLQQSDSCVFNHLSEGDSATPSPNKNTDSVAAASIEMSRKGANGSSCDGDSPAWEDGPEPLEYFLLDYHGVLPEALLDKIKKNIEMHSTCMQKLKRENEKLRRMARHRNEETLGLDAVDDMVAAPNSLSLETPLVSAGHATVRGVIDPQQSLACMTSDPQIRREASDCQTGCASSSTGRPCRTLPLCGGRMQSEIARTEARVAELEEAIRREGQKLREKDSERKAVAREVEAIRCEARAHRAKLNKHIQRTPTSHPM